MLHLPFALRSRLSVWLACWGLLTVGISSALADGVIRNGMGAISSGRGGTNIAHADNGGILLENPAAMVNIRGHSLYDVNAGMLLTDLHYADPQSSDEAACRPFGLPELAMIRRSCDGRWAFGMGVFCPAGFGAEYQLVNPVFGPQKYRSLGALAKILPGLAYRLNDRLSVGGTLGVAISHAQLEGPFYLQTAPAPLTGAPTVLDLEAKGAALTWSLGAQYEISERTTLGVTYQSESRFHMRGGVFADVFMGAPPVVSSGFDALVDLAWPRSVGVGLKHQLCEHQSISADAIWFDWPHAFDTLGIQLTNPSNPAFAAFAPIHDDLPLRWRDSVSLRLGYERELTRGRTLRAGYVYHPNVIPESTLTPYIPATLEHTFSLGYGRPLGVYHLDLAYQFSFGADRAVGTSGLVGGDFDSSQFRSRAHWIFAGISRRF